MYSFTKPKPKPLFKEDTKLWLILYIISIVLYILFSLLVLIKAYFLHKNTQKLKKEIKIMNNKIKFLKKEKDKLIVQKKLYTQINIKNLLIKQNIKNILELVPDPITLEKFLLFKNKLILYGITPTKDIYNKLLLPSLKSIFEETDTYFYKLPNGWYRFKSINKIKNKNEITSS